MTSALSRPPVQTTRSRALLVGVWNYRSSAAERSGASSVESDEPRAVGFRNLHGPEADIDEFAEALVEGGLFRREDITKLPNPAAQDLREAVEDFLKASGGTTDVALLYFSGHGYFHRGETLHLCPSDARNDKPDARMLSSSIIREQLENCSVPCKMVVLDCCFAAAFKGDESGEAVPASMAAPQASGLYVLGAGTRQAPDGEPGTMSPFTGLLVEALREECARGAATVSLERLYEVVSARANGRNLPRPHRQVRGTGEFVVARRRGAARAESVPAEPPAPSWPCFDLRFVDRQVIARLPGGEALPARPLERPWPQPALDELLAHLGRLTSNTALSEGMKGLEEAGDPAWVLTRALEVGHRLVGEELFSRLFSDDDLLEPLLDALGGTSPVGTEHAVQLRLDLTRADPALAALPWELMAVPAGRAGASSGLVGDLTTDHRVLVDRHVEPLRRVRTPAKSGDAPVHPLVRSELPDGDPLTDAVLHDLRGCANRRSAAVLAPSPQVRRPWRELREDLPEHGVLCLLAEVSGSDGEPVLHVADRERRRILGRDLVNELGGMRDLRMRLVVLETVPHDPDSNGFAATNRIARDLSRRLDCTVVAVCHPPAYRLWLRDEEGRGGSDVPLTVTGHVVQALADSRIDACLAHVAREAVQGQTPQAGIPIAYLADFPPVAGPAGAAAGGGTRGTG